MVFVYRTSAVSSGTSIGDIDVETEILLNENGAPVNYIIVNQGKPGDMYDESCDGTWCLRKDIAENRVWDSGNSNVLESSDIQAYLNGDWLTRYDPDIAEAIKQVKIPYRQGGGTGGTDQSGANGLSCKAFLLSGYEVGWTTSNSQYFPMDGAVLSYFQGTATTDSKRIAYLNGSATSWWLRSQITGNSISVWRVIFNGDYDVWNANVSYGVRPCFILPYDFKLTDDQIVGVS